MTKEVVFDPGSLISVLTMSLSVALVEFFCFIAPCFPQTDDDSSVNGLKIIFTINFSTRSKPSDDRSALGSAVWVLMKMITGKERATCWRWPTDPGELPSFAQNSSPAAARVILYWAGVSWGVFFSQFDPPVICHKSIILAWMTQGNVVGMAKLVCVCWKVGEEFWRCKDLLLEVGNGPSVLVLGVFFNILFFKCEA